MSFVVAQHATIPEEPELLEEPNADPLSGFVSRRVLETPTSMR